MKEIWKDVEGFEGYYKVSSKGRVRSLTRKLIDKNGKEYLRKGRILKSCQDDCGYFHVRLAMNNKFTLWKIHRLVAKHFLENYSDELTVNHIDHNRGNNSAENLEMMTLIENISERGEKHYFYCIQTKKKLFHPKRYIENELNLPWSRYYFLQALRNHGEYLHSGYFFKKVKCN